MKLKQTTGTRILKRKKSLEKTGEWIFFRDGSGSKWTRRPTVNNPNFFKVNVDPFIERLF